MTYPEKEFYAEQNKKLSNIRKLLFAGGLLAAAGTFYYYNQVNNQRASMGRTVYDGTVNANPIKYEEGRYCKADKTNSTKNEMTLEAGEGRYVVFTDYDNETSVYNEDEKAIFNDKLEEIVFIEDGKIISRHNRNESGNTVSTPFGVMPTDYFFESADSAYNQMRVLAKLAADLGIEYIVTPDDNLPENNPEKTK
jgi:hypothetical protein